MSIRNPNKYISWKDFLEWISFRSKCSQVYFEGYNTNRVSFYMRNPHISKLTEKNYVAFKTNDSELYLYKNSVLSISRIYQGWELILEDSNILTIIAGVE